MGLHRSHFETTLRSSRMDLNDGVINAFDSRTYLHFLVLY